jgi:RNA polymerase sigma factor (sigma-70 family)
MAERRPIPSSAGGFPLTRHSLLSLARSAEDGTRRRALDTLIACYWKPVYKYVRLRWRGSPEEAEDLTQGFFAYAMEGEFFDRYDAGRGRFRTWLRTCVDGFVANARQHAARERRGGGVVHVPLDFTTAEGELRELPIADAGDPETIFRDEWIRRLFELALADLREYCAAAGKDTALALFERYDLEPPETHGVRVTYDTLAREFAIPPTQVTNLLADARRRFRTALIERVREATGSESEFREELRDLLGDVP